MCNHNEKIVNETRLEAQVRELVRKVAILENDCRTSKEKIESLEKIAGKLINNKRTNN